MDILGHFYKYQIRNFEIKKTKNCGQATTAHSAIAFGFGRLFIRTGAARGRRRAGQKKSTADKKLLKFKDKLDNFQI